jgi:hypothetical protein
MPEVPKSLESIWKWLIVPLVHATWGHWLFLVVTTLIAGVSGFSLGESTLKQQERKGVDQLVSILIDRYSAKTPEIKNSEIQYDLTGTWSYKAKDSRLNVHFIGDVEIIQKKNGKLEFIEGHRKEIIDAFGNTKINEPPIGWKSLWAQVTLESLIRVEYIIDLDEGKTLGYLVLNPPKPPFEKLKGYYYILLPNLIFGDIILEKA